MPEPPLIEIVRSAVGEVAPTELPGFEESARAYAKTPASARAAALRPEDGPDAAGPTAALLAVAVGIALGAEPVLTGRRTRLGAWWARLRERGRSDLDRPPLPVAEADAARLEAAAVVIARERGASDELAASIGAALARHWPRRG